MRAIYALSATLLFFSFARAIEVTSNSPCYSTCGGFLTFNTDLTCNDDGYNNTDAGRKMDACLTCESTSTASLPSDGNDTAKNDLYWFLFNMKYTLEYCLFQNTSDTSGMPACDAACNGVKTVLDTSWFTTPMAGQYDYCEIDSGSFPANADTCASCLRGKPGSVVLGNFLETMNAACSSKPNATLGQTLALPVSLFKVDISSSSSPSASSTSSTSPATSSTSTSTTSTPPASSSSTSTSTSTPPISPSSGGQTSNPSKSTSSGLSTGASIGIGVGIGVAALAALAAMVAWCLMRRKRRQNENQHPEKFPNSFGESERDAGPPTYVGAPPASELHSKDARFPEEMEGNSRPGHGSRIDNQGGGRYGRAELASDVPPSELMA